MKSKRKSKKSYHQMDEPDKHSSKTSTSNQKNQGKNSHGKKNHSNKSKQHKHKKEKNDDYSFRQKIQNEGEREIIEMVADGNCLFRSISHQLYNDYGQKHDVVRHDICTYLEENEDDFKVYLLLEDSNDGDDVCDFDDYIDQMRMDGEWGGDVEIVCAARLYKRTITIFSNAGAYNISIDDDEEKSGPNILLSYHDNMHYNSVHDRSNNYIGSSTSSNINTATQSAQTSKRKKNKSIRTEKNKSNIDQNDGGNDVMTSQSHKSNRSSEGRKKNDDDTDNEQKVKDSGNTNVSSKKQLTQRRNDLCSCGSGLRYKKCCLAKEKNSIRLKKFREKHALQGYNKRYDNAEYKDTENDIELDGGFAVLNI